jgi:hypothetical protein
MCLLIMAVAEDPLSIPNCVTLDWMLASDFIELGGCKTDVAGGLDVGFLRQVGEVRSRWVEQGT